jgi:membrane protease YdiL (CAAX protease family)
VFLPFCFGWALNVAVAMHFAQRYSSVSLVAIPSVLTPDVVATSKFGVIGLAGPVSLLAIVLVAIAFVRLELEATQLPVQLPVRSGDDRGAASATAKFLWCVLVLTYTFSIPLNAIDAVVHSFDKITAAAQSYTSIYDDVWRISWAIGFVAMVWWSTGTDRNALIKKSLRIPGLKYVLLAIAFPFYAASTIPLLRFAAARAGFKPGTYAQDYVTGLADYFPSFQWHPLIKILPALAEEIAWRGYLQPKFIRRFGLYRGIFLVGIVWGAFHFPWMFADRMHMGYFSKELLIRLFNCVTWGFVLSWLTLQARSVIPAAIAHGLMNALVDMGWSGNVNSVWTHILYVPLAFALFRFWPPKLEFGSDTGSTPDDALPDTGEVAESPA